MFKLDICDESFIKKSQQNIKIKETINKPISEIFEILTTEKIKDFIDDFISYKWTTQNINSVNSERIIKLKFMRAKEVFINWDHDKRITFYFESMSIPLAKSIMEDWIFDKVNENETLLTWTIYYNPNLISKILHPIIKKKFSKMQESTLYNLKKF